MNNNSKLVSLLWPFHGRGVELAHLLSVESGIEQTVTLRGGKLSMARSAPLVLYRAPEPRRFTQRPRRGFALSVATLVTFAKRKKKPRREAGAARRSFAAQ